MAAEPLRLAGRAEALPVLPHCGRGNGQSNHRPASGDHRAARGRSDALHNTNNANDSALAVLREKAFQADRFENDVPSERSTRYREGVREAVASLLDPFQPDNDEASRLAHPAPAQAKSPT